MTALSQEIMPEDSFRALYFIVEIVVLRGISSARHIHFQQVVSCL